MKNQKLVFTGTMVLLLLSLIGTGIFYSSNRSLTCNLSEAKVNMEQLMVEKSLLDKELRTYKENASDLQSTNQSLEKMLNGSKMQMNEKLSEIAKLKKENSSVKSLRKQLAEMTQMKTNAENMALADKKRMQSEINSLNSTLASLQSDNKELAGNLELLRAVTADNFHLEADKKKDKLTVIAKRTRQIKLNFDMPQGIETDIKFNITKPDGSKISGSENGIAFRVSDNNNSSLSASVNEATALKLSKKVEMMYHPKEKLKAGDYIIEMTNKNMHVAYCHVKLR